MLGPITNEFGGGVVEADILPLQEPNVHLISSKRKNKNIHMHEPHQYKYKFKCNKPTMIQYHHTIDPGCESDQSESDPDSVSESTNPYLERLLDLYFPSDDEDVGCEADGEYDATDGTANGDVDVDVDGHKSFKRRSPPPLKYQSPARRRRSPLRSRKNSHYNQYRSTKSADQATSIVVVDGVKSEDRDNMNMVPAFDTVEWLQEARRQYVVGEVQRQTAKLQMNNSEWDSSPSSVDADSKEKEGGEAQGVSTTHSIGDFDEENSGQSKNDVRKSLFAPVVKDRIIGVRSYRDNCDEKDNTDTDDENDDLELTYRARQIQHDLRLQEMKELAVEAERAAEEGREKFVGNATKFGVDDTTLSFVSQRSTPRKGTINDVEDWTLRGSSASDCKQQQPEPRPEHSVKTKPQSPRLISAMTHKHTSYRATPKKEIKRPKSLTSKDRLSSAPSKLQNRNPSPPLADVPTMTSILTAKSFLSLTQSKFSEKKIPVLSLRHMEEVIPSFGEMHHYLRSHIIRAGVEEGTLTCQANEVMNKSGKECTAEKESGAGSRTSSNSLFHIQSFQKLFNSFSNLSAEESTKPKELIEDSDLEMGPASEAEKYLERCSIVANTDCASLVSCGDSSLDEDIIHKQVKQVVEDSFSDDDEEKDDEIGEYDNHVVLDTSGSSEIYVQTLASEIHSPGRRPRSPPGPSLYSDIDDNLKAFIETSTPLDNGSPPKSRWASFLVNMSPTRNFAIPAPRRAQSMTLDRKTDFNSFIRPRLASYHSFREQPPMLLSRSVGSQQWLSGNNDAYPRSGFTPISRDNQEFDKQNDATFQNQDSNHGYEVDIDAIDRPSTNKSSRSSLKTSATQRSSYESDSGESAFSRYSKYSKIYDSINEEDSDALGMSMRSVKENDEILFDDFPHPSHRRQSSVTIDRDSATSPKPPLHPAGIRLATVLLNNVGIKNGAEGKDHPSKKSETFSTGRISPNNTANEASVTKISGASKNLTKQNKVDLIHSQHTNQDASTSHLTYQNQSQQRTGGDEHGKSDGITSSRNNMKRENSFSSIRSCCLGEESSVCDDNNSINVGFEEIMENAGQPDDEGDEATEEEKNKSMSSFMDLMENVKVPSMMQRLSPLLGRKEMENKSDYEDDSAFIGNYFYVGVGTENEEVVQHDEARFVQFHHNRSRFCQRNQCADAGCEYFGTHMLEHTFNFLSTKSSWDKESGPLLNEPQNYDGHPWLKKALSQCAGHQLHRRRQEVVIGQQRFRAPNLSIQKGGFFSREEDEEMHETFKVGHAPIGPDKSIEDLENFIFPGIEIGPIKEDIDLGISISEVGDLTEEYKAARYRETMKRPSCRSLLTFSDDDHSSLDNI